MPLPFIAAGALYVVGVAGAGLAADGIRRMKLARDTQAESKTRHDNQFEQVEVDRAAAESAAAQYGALQLTILRDTIGTYVIWLEANEQKVRAMNRTVVDGVEVSLPNLPELRREVQDAADVLKGGVAAAAASVAARQAALAGVKALATAGTGVAIGNLSGAAAESAILAWLGGGTVASGGGGVAAGGTVLSAVAVAPAVLIGGLTLNGQGHKAQRKAKQYAADVTVAIERLIAMSELLGQIQRRLSELSDVLRHLDDRAQVALTRLGSVDFDPDRHTQLFLDAAQLVRAIRQVLEAAVVDEDGLTKESEQVLMRYKTI
jgi:hypothetical protein